MADVFVLDVLLYGTPIGTLTRVDGDRTLFAFNENYIADSHRPVLGLGFKDNLGELITEFRPYQTAVMPFFSNLLPEARLRKYLAERGGVNEKREFFLLWLLGEDLPGALSIRPADGEMLPPPDDDHHHDDDERRAKALRFSLAGVQLKFSAVTKATGGLTIPANGVGGSWILKLPSEKYEGVPENEYSMLTLARLLGMDVPAIELVDVDDIGNLPDGIGALKERYGLAIERFDRLSDGTAVHIEDFAQVFGLYPEEKYEKASSMNIARVIAAESNEADVAEFIRRLTFNTLIGNADMHVKNWSMIYPDRRIARLAPAYDFVSTIAYIPDKKAALTYSRSKRFDEFTEDELSHLAARARLPKTLVLETARETVAQFHKHWKAEKKNLPLRKDVVAAVEAHLKTIPLAVGRH
ncbi:MAG: HipA domain-containing protein [Gammaproteobacteria bacterium]|nr:HipA domain-containing protein [Gammaproteobacteria bacterium]